MTENSLNFPEILTWVVHVTSLGFTFFVIYIALANEIVLFTWHPILLTIGWMLAATEGILAISSKNLLTKGLSFQLRVRYHWIFQTTTIACTIIGFIVVFVNKNIHNKHHFKSWHGIIGLITVILTVSASIGGLITLYNTTLKNYLSPNVNKLFHTAAGIITFVFGTVTILLGLYTGWFKRNSTETTQVLCFVIVSLTALLILVQPMRTFSKRLF